MIIATSQIGKLFGVSVSGFEHHYETVWSRLGLLLALGRQHQCRSDDRFCVGWHRPGGRNYPGVADAAALSPAAGDLAAVIIMAVINVIKIEPVIHAWKAEHTDGVVAVVTDQLGDRYDRTTCPLRNPIVD